MNVSIPTRLHAIYGTQWSNHFSLFRIIQKADAAAERLRIKAELQKKNAKPMSFTESMAVEKAKQKELQKSKEERRNALCEELGRGC